MTSRKFARREERSILGQGLGWILALGVLYFILVLPDRLGALRAVETWRLPLELPLIVFVLVAAPGVLRALVRVVIAFSLAVVLLFKIANMAAYFGFARPFSPLVDALMVPTLLDTLSKAAGKGAAIGALAGVAVIVLLLLTLLAWVTGTVGSGVHQRNRAGVALVALAVVGLGFTQYASFNASRFVRAQTVMIAQSLRDAEQFRVQLLENPFADLPVDQKLAGLKNVDVLLIFVEAYGRAALDNPAYAPKLRATLQQFGAELQEKGFAARSGWMASPTFGGESYLAHSTAVSGLLVNDQQRYVQLLRSQRRTLVHDFNDAGWRTVAVMPEITMPWPEADYFTFGKIYTAQNLEYKGKSFGYMTMPDQYTLSAFQTRELAPTDRKPVMAEIALVSSHIPWAPIPKPVPWENVGDGSIFTTERTPETADDVWRTPSRVPEFYALSIDYTLQTLKSFVTTYGNERTLFIIIGDHQPMTFIAGEGAPHDVPVHMIAKDPAILAALDEGAWAAGMEPDAASAPWPMDSLRARILQAFTRVANAPLSAESEAPPQTAPQAKP